jgi:hypothetical protein
MDGGGEMKMILHFCMRRPKAFGASCFPKSFDDIAARGPAPPGR